MKRTLSMCLALLACSLVCHAAEFYTGAYYTTKAPLLVAREAGQVELEINDDGSVLMQCYYNSAPSLTLTGTWSIVRGKIKVFASKDLNPSGLPRFAIFRGYARSGFAYGTFSVAHTTGRFTGKWQATFP